jgi:hypothetical protein
MEDVPWHYIAMIFIAFASWIYSRVQEAAEARRRKAESRKASSEARRAANAPPPSPYRTAAPSPSARSQAPSPPSAQPSASDGPRTFREFLELLRETAEGGSPAVDDDEPWIETAKPPPPLPTTPPPKPSAPRAVVASSAPPAAPRKQSSSPLAKALGSQTSIRQAIILKEILDQPISLRQS